MICILKIGIGNINSLAGRLKKININFKITDNSKILIKSKIIIIPGVANSSAIIKQLKKKKLFILLNKIKSKTKIIGLCAGMQIFANSLEEGGEKGLGWIKADVLKLKSGKNESNGKAHNVGWGKIFPYKKKYPKIRGQFYFNHSYSLKLRSSEKNLKIYYSMHEKTKFVAMFVKKNLYGIQFHPERSNKSGINLLKQILN